MQASRLLILSKPQRPPAALLDLFRNGEAGDIWLPHFTKYAFQDAAMTIPAVPGMPLLKMIGLINGTVATFTNVTLQQNAAGKKYLAFNGASSSGATSAIDFSATDKMTVLAGVRKESDAAGGFVCELTASATANAGGFYVAAPISAAGNYGVAVNNGAEVPGQVVTTYTAPITNTLSVAFDTTATTQATTSHVRVNGTLIAGAATVVVTANSKFANAVLNIGARNGASFRLNGGLFGLVARGALTSSGQLADAEREMNRYTGAY